MSSASDSMIEKLLCCICMEVFNDPVSTPCGHNFCRICLNTYWDSSQNYRCPCCNKTFEQRPELNINKTVRECVFYFKKKTQVVLCDICEEAKQKAVKSCLVCRRSYCETHLESHLTVTGLQKHKLIDPVNNLQDYICQTHKIPLELFCKDDQTCVCVICTITNHKTHNIVYLKEEMLVRSPMLYSEKKHLKGWGRQQWSQSAFHLISKLFEAVMCCMWYLIPVGISLLMYLYFYPDFETLSIEKLREAVDVTLDPDTAHPYLILSEDKKQVRLGDIKYELPDNPKRFDMYINVLGKQGFSSGRFYFEVQVKGKTDWQLGVARESVNRKSETTLAPVWGFWTVALRTENRPRYTACDDVTIPLYLRMKPQKVGVFVDYEEGLVSFYNVKSGSHIYSFTDQSFTGKLYPYFSPGLNDKGKNVAPLIITPIQSISFKYEKLHNIYLLFQ